MTASLRDPVRRNTNQVMAFKKMRTEAKVVFKVNIEPTPWKNRATRSTYMLLVKANMEAEITTTIFAWIMTFTSPKDSISGAANSPATSYCGSVVHVTRCRRVD